MAHAAALSELYVILATAAPDVGLALREFRREGEAREPFRGLAGQRRALPPDALVVLADEQRRELRGLVELDLGTMSHRRLRAKAQLYGAYHQADAWQQRHPFCPSLLFLTTGEQRATRFLKTLAGVLEVHHSSGGALVAGVCDAALDPGRALAEACWLDLGLQRRLTLGGCLEAARAPYDRERAARAAHQRAEAQQSERLLSDMDALRGHLREKRWALGHYLRAFGDAGVRAFETAIESNQPLEPAERAALEVFARQLGDDVLDLGLRRTPDPDEPDRRAVQALIDLYRARQRARIEELVGRYGELPVLRRARQRLDNSELLEGYAVDALAGDAKRELEGREEQQRRRCAYLGFREDEARRLARERGLLRRFSQSREELYPLVDQRWLKVCEHCRELVYPGESEHHDGFPVPAAGPRCHYCHAHHLEELAPKGTALLDARPDPETAA